MHFLINCFYREKKWKTHVQKKRKFKLTLFILRGLKKVFKMQKQELLLGLKKNKN